MSSPQPNEMPEIAPRAAPKPPRGVSGRVMVLVFLGLIATALSVYLVARQRVFAARDAERAAEMVRRSAVAPIAAAGYRPRDRSLDYTAAVAESDRMLHWQTARTAPNNSSLEYEALAGIYRGRAQLTGDYDSYADAESALDKAFAIAPPLAGPYPARARLALTLHRVPQAEADLAIWKARPFLDSSDRTAIAMMEGDLAMLTGRFADARTAYYTAEALEPTSGTMLAVALLSWRSGAMTQARDRLEDAFRRYQAPRGQFTAWSHVQLAQLELDRGQFAAALRDLDEAEEDLPGWWLIAEHRARTLDLLGRATEARAIYEQLAAVPGHPEHLDGLAGLLRDGDDPFLAESFIARARALHEERLARFPEAATGHAVDHFLHLESDPARALELAERDHALRPGLEQTVKLAQAYVKAHRLTDARDVLAPMRATLFSSAELHGTASIVFTALGDAASAEEARRRAEAIDPLAMPRLAWLTALTR